ncbi:hypothetical protein V6N12_003619 [Hibiscus sabdariffa]|uniref:Bulb-type lectin domain-containing protein n=1 Tax=Hibiscus sabdariffa TaxID=183260 RepID=A0ABR2B368_9ROSI
MFSFRVLVLILGCLWLTEAATNTLNHGDMLSLSNSLVSQNGAVSLGFHRQDYGRTWDDKEFGYYLAMYYTGDTMFTEDKYFNHSIWLANRDDPIADDSGVLVVDDTGLKINRTGGNPIQLFSLQSTSITINSSDMRLVLHNSGNLVLQGTDTENGENVVLWQSFDHPTDTLLPEPMKLGVSHGRRMSLTSWLTDSIPASGSLTLEWDPVGNLLVVRLRERVLWATGELLSDLNGIYNITYVSSPDEQYIYYTIVNSTLGENPRLLLHHDASLDFGGSFGGIITSYKCDGHSTEKGCKRWEGPKCRNKGDKFELRSIRTTYTNDTLIRNLSLSINDCKDICWNNCNCLGVNAEMDLGCQFLSGPYDEGVLDGVSFQVINRNRSKSKTWIWILISIVIALTIIVLLSTLFYLRRQSRARKEEKFLLDLMTSEDARELQTGNKGYCFHNHRPCLNKNMFGSRVLVLILGCLWLTEAATNTLNHGDKLNLSDSLVSQNGAVSLGFHRLDYDQTWDGKEFGYYLAMYYTGDTSLNHSIWLANRDDPITDNSGVLAVDDTGLRINHTGGNPIQLFSLQSTSITISSSDMKLVLQDSENLVLQGTDIENGENVVLWQSFDHPTDTLLPEPMRLGFSHGRRMSLTSWLTDSIPASGSFTLEWDPVGNLLIVRLRERVFWSTGDLLSLDGNRIYNFTYVSSPDEQYLYYTTVINPFSLEKKPQESKTWIWIVISIAIALTIIAVLSTLFYLRRQRRARKEEEYLLDLMTSEDASDIRELQTGNKGHNLNIYTVEAIVSATNGFSPDNLLGKGGFGPVFKVSAKCQPHDGGIENDFINLSLTFENL